MSCKCALTPSTNGHGICLHHSLNGTSSVTFIMCLVEWVQPSSLGSREKCHGTQPGETRWSSPAQVAKILTHLNLTFRTTSPVFALWTASVAGCPGPHPMPQSSQSHLWLQHLICCYYPCHWNLPPQGLKVCCAISHYDSDGLAATVHLSVSVLYCQAFGQWSLVSMQGLGHHIQPCTSECSRHPCMHDSGWEGINSLTVLGGNYFIVFHGVQYLSGNLVIPNCGSSWPYHSGIDPRGCQGIYLSLSTFMMQLIIGIPMITGTHAMMLDKSGTTRAIWSSS